MEVRVFSTAPSLLAALAPDPGAPVRILILGNAGGGKSTLSRLLAVRLGIPAIELDRLLWQPGWVPVPAEVFAARLRVALAGERWVMEGLGLRATLPERLARATAIVLVDLPAWCHYALAAERQAEWCRGGLADPPAGLREPPALRALFKTIADVDRLWLPALRSACDDAERRGIPVRRIRSLPELFRSAGSLRDP